MKLAILTIGSRGDVQPFIPLAHGLQQAGHTVRIITHEPFRDFVTSHGVEFAPLAGNPEELLKSEVGQRMMSAEKKLEAIREYVKLLEPLAIPCAEQTLAGCRDVDAVLCMFSAYMYGEAVAEYLKIPLIQISLCPIAPSRVVPGPMATPWPKWVKPLSVLGGHWYHQKLILDLQSLVFRKQTNLFRREVFGLPKRSGLFGMKTFSPRGHTWIYGYSPHVAPKPPDWGDRQHVVGWWFLDGGSSWTPPADLVAFLDRGPPPVYVGFGSMYSPDRERVARSIIDALQQTRQRGILAKGWGLLDPKDVPENCFVLDAAPHDWLFPRMAAVVHHGGAGTTGAGARAGVPNIVVPFAYDQPFWGRCLQHAGVAPAPIPVAKMTTDNFAAALRVVTSDDRMKRSAAELGQRIRAERGVERAVELIERELQGRRPAEPGRSSSVSPTAVTGPAVTAANIP